MWHLWTPLGGRSGWMSEINGDTFAECLSKALYILDAHEVTMNVVERFGRSGWAVSLDEDEYLILGDHLGWTFGPS